MAMKRPSSAANSIAKRRKKDVGTVVASLADSDALAADLRSVLKTGLPIVLLADKADRHTFENELIDQAGRALAAVQASMEEKLKAATAARDSTIAKTERSKREAAKKAAEDAREQLKAAQVAKAEEVTKLGEAMSAAKKALKEAGKDAAKADSDMQTLANTKDSLSASLLDLTSLQQGTVAGPAGKKALSNLTKVAKEHGFDTTMSTTFVVAAKKATAERTDFEITVFTNFQASINSSIEAFTKQIAEAEPVKAEKHAAEEAAKAALVAAETALATGKEQLTAAEAAYKQSGKDLSKASAHLNNVWSDMKKACDAADDIDDVLKDFTGSVMEKFELLKASGLTVEETCAAILGLIPVISEEDKPIIKQLAADQGDAGIKSHLTKYLDAEDEKWKGVSAAFKEAVLAMLEAGGFYAKVKSALGIDVDKCVADIFAIVPVIQEEDKPRLKEVATAKGDAGLVKELKKYLDKESPEWLSAPSDFKKAVLAKLAADGFYTAVKKAVGWAPSVDDVATDLLKVHAPNIGEEDKPRLKKISAEQGEAGLKVELCTFLDTSYPGSEHWKAASDEFKEAVHAKLVEGGFYAIVNSVLGIDVDKAVADILAIVPVIREEDKPRIKEIALTKGVPGITKETNKYLNEISPEWKAASKKFRDAVFAKLAEEGFYDKVKTAVGCDEAPAEAPMETEAPAEPAA